MAENNPHQNPLQGDLSDQASDVGNCVDLNHAQQNEDAANFDFDQVSFHAAPAASSQPGQGQADMQTYLANIRVSGTVDPRHLKMDLSIGGTHFMETLGNVGLYTENFQDMNPNDIGFSAPPRTMSSEPSLIFDFVPTNYFDGIQAQVPQDNSTASNPQGHTANEVQYPPSLAHDTQPGPGTAHPQHRHQQQYSPQWGTQHSLGEMVNEGTRHIISGGIAAPPGSPNVPNLAPQPHQSPAGSSVFGAGPSFAAGPLSPAGSSYAVGPTRKIAQSRGHDLRRDALNRAQAFHGGPGYTGRSRQLPDFPPRYESYTSNPSVTSPRPSPMPSGIIPSLDNTWVGPRGWIQVIEVSRPFGYEPDQCVQSVHGSTNGKPRDEGICLWLEKLMDACDRMKEGGQVFVTVATYPSPQGTKIMPMIPGDPLGTQGGQQGEKGKGKEKEVVPGCSA